MSRWKPRELVEQCDALFVALKPGLTMLQIMALLGISRKQALCRACMLRDEGKAELVGHVETAKWFQANSKEARDYEAYIEAHRRRRPSRKNKPPDVMDRPEFKHRVVAPGKWKADHKASVSSVFDLGRQA